MSDNRGYFYYLSADLIDQVYRSVHGPLTEKTHVKQSDRTWKFSLKAGLDKLLKLLGLSGGVEANLERKRMSGETTKVLENVEDRALVLMKEVFTSEKLTDISNIVNDAKPKPFYSFVQPIRLDYKKNATTGYSVHVSSRSSQLTFSGITSDGNWRAPSLKNSLVWQSKQNKSPGIRAAGILSPISITRKGDTVEVGVQFFLIFHPSLIE
jgi:hypothetical protein